MTKKHILIVILLSYFLTLPSAAQEVITLATPEAKPSNPVYRIEKLTLTSDDPNTPAVDEGVIIIQLLGANGEAVTCTYNSASAPTGTFLLNALNKANLSLAYATNATTGSLKQRIYHRLVVMGESTAVCGKTLTGTVTGAVP